MFSYPHSQRPYAGLYRSHSLCRLSWWLACGDSLLGGTIMETLIAHLPPALSIVGLLPGQVFQLSYKKV